MKDERGWYDVAQGPTLLQGDLLPNCPVFEVTHPASWPISADSDVRVEARTFDLIVMTQSCDLENEKVPDLVLAQFVAWPDLVRAEVARGNEAIRSSKVRKLLIEGNLPGLSLLHKREEQPPLPWSVVNFHRLFTIPKAFVSQYAASLGPRLRLRSPYREHLAQAFARYFMRVGLPHDARAFEKEGDVKP